MASSLLPLEPFDGQIFIDYYKVKWVYDGLKNCWQSDGKIDEIPIANSKTTGLLSKELKSFIDTVQNKGGGFGLILKPGSNNRASNRDGVIFGNVLLDSESLDIKCVNSKGETIDKPCACFSEFDAAPPGFNFNFSEVFLSNFCVEVPGGAGPRGPQGNVGDDGADGTGDGPQGDTGDPGKDATIRNTLTGVKIIESDNIFDTAVVDMKLDSGKLILKRGKVSVPVDNSTPASEIVAKRLMRVLNFGDCFKYTLQTIPCSPPDANSDIGELLDPDPAIAYFPKHFDPSKLGEISNYQPVRATLSALVNDIITFYQGKLLEAAKKFDDQAEAFLLQKDEQVRTILDKLLADLFVQQAKETPEWCMGVNKDCVPLQPIIDAPEFRGIVTDPEVVAIFSSSQSAAAALRADFLLSAIVTGDTPIYSYLPVQEFEMPGIAIGCTEVSGICTNTPGCWVQSKNGVLSFIANNTPIPAGSVPYNGSIDCGKLPPKIRTEIIPDPNSQAYLDLEAELLAEIPPNTTELARLQNGYPSSDVIAKLYQNWSDNVSAHLQNGRILFRNTRIGFSAVSFEFPPGVYAFVYDSGAFSQPRLSRSERHGLSQTDPVLHNGLFQKYWVGNEVGSASGVGKNVFILNPYNRSIIKPFNSEVVSDQIGLEIGWSPTSYVDNIPVSLFNTSRYTPEYLSGVSQFSDPLEFTDISNLTPNQGIMWSEFPAIGGSAINDPFDLEDAYKVLPWNLKMILFKTPEPGFFYSRVKTAINFTNLFGSFIMPPYVVGNVNSALLYDSVRFTPPTINARPIAAGSVKLNVLRIVST